MSVTVRRTDNVAITVELVGSHADVCLVVVCDALRTRVATACRLGTPLGSLTITEAHALDIALYAYQMALARALEREEQGGLRLPPNTEATITGTEGDTMPNTTESTPKRTRTEASRTTNRRGTTTASARKGKTAASGAGGAKGGSAKPKGYKGKGRRGA
jgi:hypothetical protein